MNCPACHAALAVLEYDEVELDCCLACGGIWLDAGELELLFDAREKAGRMMQGAAALPAAPRAKPRRCPECARRMSEHRTAGMPPVTFDACPRGDGLWFDRGELATVLEAGGIAPEDEAVVAWLRGLFAAGAPRGE